MESECFDKEGQRTNTPPSKQEFEGKRRKEGNVKKERRKCRKYEWNKRNKVNYEGIISPRFSR
jgi:hypothetical protein